jgi:hypothetical protein
VETAVETGTGASEALIYLPGLGLAERKSLAGVVTRITRAIDTSAATRATRWHVEWSSDLVTGARNAPATPAATIVRKPKDAPAQPVIDVYQYDWLPDLTKKWEEQSVFRRAARVLLSLFNVVAVWRTFAAARHSKKGLAQLIMASLMLLVMVAYAALVLFAAGQAVQQIYISTTGETTHTTSSPARGAPSSPVSGERPSVAGPSAPASAPHRRHPAEKSPVTTKVTGWQWAALLSTIGVLFLKKSRNRVRSAGATLFAAQSYLRVAERKPEIVGGLRTLCETLAETERYETVRVLAYSFGCVVAIDALYPREGDAERSFDDVSCLATIGAPYDFVRAVRRDWADGRHVRTTKPIRWLNFYSPVDLLGSNFRSDSSDGDATTGIRAVDGATTIRPDENRAWDLGIAMNLADLLQLYGFASHGMYWGTDDVDDRNVFAEVVPLLFSDSDLLT